MHSSRSVKTLVTYGQAAIEVRAGQSDAAADKQTIAQAIRRLIQDSGISTNNVAVNLPSNRVFTAVTEWDQMPPGDLAKTIRYQASSIIPTPLAQSTIDWVIIGNSPKDSKKIEVLLSSVPNGLVAERLELLESVGLNVVAFEPDNTALARSLVPAEATTPQLLLDVGYLYTDLVIVAAGVPYLARSISIGTEAAIRMAAQNMSITAEQAQQMVFKFGLARDRLEGRIYSAIAQTIEGLIIEIEKSIKFFSDRRPNSKVDRIIVTGGAAAIPELPLYLANRFGINVEIGNPWRNVSFPASRAGELQAVSNHFAIAAGLAERTSV